MISVEDSDESGKEYLHDRILHMPESNSGEARGEARRGKRHCDAARELMRVKSILSSYD